MRMSATVIHGFLFTLFEVFDALLNYWTVRRAERLARALGHTPNQHQTQDYEQSNQNHGPYFIAGSHSVSTLSHPVTRPLDMDR